MPEQPRYNKASVDQAIAQHNRRPRGGRIGRQEGKLIHALLKGRQKEDT
jgi:hypothetical protein